MLGEEGIEIFITFLLGVAGYTGLTGVIILSIRGYVPLLFWRISTLIILLHVLMIWTYRYDWQFSLAVRNGYGGFIIFHTALLMILLSHLNRSKSLLLIRISFLVVTMGAVGAVSRYDVVAMYKIPVLVCAAAGSSTLIWNYFHKWLNKSLSH